MKNVLVVIGPGQIGQAIARRVGIGQHVVLADQRRENADAAEPGPSVFGCLRFRL